MAQYGVGDETRRARATSRLALQDADCFLANEARRSSLTDRFLERSPRVSHDADRGDQEKAQGFEETILGFEETTLGLEETTLGFEEAILGIQDEVREQEDHDLEFFDPVEVGESHDRGQEETVGEQDDDGRGFIAQTRFRFFPDRFHEEKVEDLFAHGRFLESHDLISFYPDLVQEEKERRQEDQIRRQESQERFLEDHVRSLESSIRILESSMESLFFPSRGVSLAERLDLSMGSHLRSSSEMTMGHCTVGVLARSMGLARSTLLYYERIGLLRPLRRSATRYRLYGEEARSRLESIRTFRDVGLGLSEIRKLLDGGGGKVEAVLTARLTQLNDEIVRLREQQRVIVRLLGNRSLLRKARSLDKRRWVEILAAAGLDEEGMRRWHVEFERLAPESHQDFLEALGISSSEIARIRSWSR